MATWKEYFKEYEIICWNEANFDIKSNQYVHEAYQAKQWAFVADYVRLYALFHYGGIYLDVDVKVLKKMDSFLKHSAFFGYECLIRPQHIGTGTIGAKKNHPFIKDLLEDYEKESFYKSDGSLNQTTNVIRVSELALRKYNFKETGLYEVIDQDIHIYPYEFFSGNSGSNDCEGKLIYTVTDQTYTIHEFAGSWLPSKNHLKKRIRNKIKQKIGKDCYEKFKNIFKRNN